MFYASLSDATENSGTATSKTKVGLWVGSRELHSSNRQDADTDPARCCHTSKDLENASTKIDQTP